MHFSISAIFAVFAAVSTLAVAAPSGKPENKTMSKRYAFSGTCNGTSCKIGLINYSCDQGSCVGPNGGDGATCYAENSLAQGPYICPAA